VDAPRRQLRRSRLEAKLGSMDTQACVRQLYKEYDVVLYRYGVKMTSPVIRVEVRTAHLGTWDPLMRTITLSQRLVEAHPWDIVIEILKHEMAHQMVDEVYKGSSGHGRDFKEACRALGVADWAVAASGELPGEPPNWRTSTLTDEQDRLLRRVEKLLALAGSSNEHEAALAMQRVQDMYRKYNLDQVAGRKSPELVYSIVCRKRHRLSRAEAMIFSILSEHYFVRVVHGWTFDAKDGCEYVMAELMGSRENVLMAEYVHSFLWHQIHSLWADFQKKTSTSGRRKGSYLLGVLLGFREKLRQSAEPVPEKAPDGTSLTALVEVAEKRIDEFVRSRYPKVSRLAGRTFYGDASLLEAGKAEGRKLTLRKAVTERQGNRANLLPPKSKARSNE
jgi:hypothetical protein